MTDELYEAITTQRDILVSPDDPSRGHETWLLTEGLVNLEQMKSLMPFLCGGGDVFPGPDRRLLPGRRTGFQGGGPFLTLPRTCRAYYSGEMSAIWGGVIRWEVLGVQVTGNTGAP